MATRDDVLDAIRRIETTGSAGDTARAAQAALTLELPGSGYDRVLDQLRSAYPRAFGPGEPAWVAAPPGGQQQGRAAQAMKDAEAALGRQLSVTVEFDRQVIEALRHARQTTAEGRRRLDNLEAEITGAARAWDLSTAVGAREFQRFLIAKLGEIIRVVEETNDDDTSKHALATALTMLYAAHTGRDEPEPADRKPEPADGSARPPAEPVPGAMAYTQDDPDLDSYLDPYFDQPTDAVQPGYPTAPRQSSEVPSMPALPGFGGESPGFGGMPPAMPAGLPLTGLRTEASDGDVATDEAHPLEDAAPVEDAVQDDPDSRVPDDESAPESSHDNGPVTVRLPDGATTSVADPRLAAAMQAAADGTPVAEAFRRQGIDIPPPGTPVTAPVAQAGLRPGDIGVFTDRHALAVGEGKALLDGQIHLTDNLRGPGFLGWQHPLDRTAEPPVDGQPVPTRTAGELRA